MNNYEQYLSNEINKNYQNLPDINFLELLKLIYKIYFSENIFINISDSLKFQLDTLLKIIIKNNSWYLLSFDKKDLLSINNCIFFIVLIQKTINFYTNFIINKELKQSFENYLLAWHIIKEEDIIFNKNIYSLYLNNNLSNEKIIEFFSTYNINILSDPILNIKNTKIPNFYLQQKNQMIDHQYEFCHLLFKIYAPLLYEDFIFQEGKQYKISANDIVFDCGGNLGLFALYCASQGAQVYCFEPMSYVRNFLTQSQALYPNNIHIVPYGVSNEELDLVLYQTFNPGASSTFLDDMPNTSPKLYKEKCHMITLDNFCQKFNIIPTFIKADIEGSEMKMLQGGKSIISQYKPILNICLNHKEIDQFLLPSFIYTLNNQYQFFYLKEGDIRSKFVLCK